MLKKLLKRVGVYIMDLFFMTLGIMVVVGFFAANIIIIGISQKKFVKFMSIFVLFSMTSFFILNIYNAYHQYTVYTDIWIASYTILLMLYMLFRNLSGDKKSPISIIKNLGLLVFLMLILMVLLIDRVKI